MTVFTDRQIIIKRNVQYCTKFVYLIVSIILIIMASTCFLFTHFPVHLLSAITPIYISYYSSCIYLYDRHYHHPYFVHLSASMLPYFIEAAHTHSSIISYIMAVSAPSAAVADTVSC